MPRKVICPCGTVNRLPEDADLSRSRCAKCDAWLAEPDGLDGDRDESKEETAKNEPMPCFLCERTARGKRFLFFSGVMKGGTTHEMLSCKVTFFERWSDLTKHEIHVCQECQLRLWRRRQFAPMVLYGSGAAVAVLLALVGVIFLTGMAAVAAAVLAGFAALALGGFFVFHLHHYRTRKPKRAPLDPLVIRASMDRLPNPQHTYLTAAQYIERHKKGIFA
jgi:hypothetical protein